MRDDLRQRRSEIEHYFDRTAVAAWEKLTSDAPVGRIRQTVRAGRDEMRATLLSWLGMTWRVSASLTPVVAQER